MEPSSERELVNTREKLRMLEEAYEVAKSDATEGAHVRELSMRSLKRLINQLKEEIARYEAHHPAAG
jgi:flagellar biosynthesis chaperone FliJ